MKFAYWLKRYFYTEHYLYRLFGIIVLLILIGVGFRNWFEYRTLNEEISHTAYRDAKILQEYFVSVRSVYHTQFIKSGVELNEETVGFLPAHAASLISDDFQQHTTQSISVRNISDQNRNPHNAPHPYERDAIEYFKKSPDAKEIFREIRVQNGKIAYFYAAPLKIEPYCLMCHGKREDAPAFIRETYSTGYNYQLGDVRGITSITVEKTNLLQSMQNKYRYRMIMSALIVIIIIGLIFLLVQRARKIEKTMMKELESLSFIDHLTQLCNRRKLSEWIAEYHFFFERYGEAYSLIMADIDHFKEVNDTLGHPVGDKVLQEFAEILKKKTRQVDHVARWGGEEFMIVLPKTTFSQAMLIAESIRDEVDSHTFECVGHKTASFGVVEVTADETLETLLERIDRALYKAKENGRNQVVGDEGS
jgi:diguanylate cyclase (GGDEF)-like protein